MQICHVEMDDPSTTADSYRLAQSIEQGHVRNTTVWKRNRNSDRSGDMSYRTSRSVQGQRGTFFVESDWRYRALDKVRTG